MRTTKSFNCVTPVLLKASFTVFFCGFEHIITTSVNQINKKSS